MKVLQLYNQYRSKFGGEDVVVESTRAIIEKNGGEALLFQRSSRGMDESLSGKFRAFANGFYSPSSRRDLDAVLREERPHVVHAHNLYPMLSPSVLLACRERRIPVVLSLHNYSLSCPTSAHLSSGKTCDRCLNGREYFCVLKNCRKNIFESTAYALRSASARKFGFFRNYVDRYIALSQFARERLVNNGFEAARIRVLPNMVSIPHEACDPSRGGYVAFAGRMVEEKGVETLLDAARALPEVPFRLAGDGPRYDSLRARAATLSNVSFVGRLSQGETTNFYRGARMLVIPSIWYEMCPLVISEAMSHGLPVVASRLGGMTELVDEDVTGVFFEAGNAGDLERCISALWRDRAACVRLGEAGRAKAAQEYGEAAYGDRLIALYEEVIRRGAGSPVA